MRVRPRFAVALFGCIALGACTSPASIPESARPPASLSLDPAAYTGPDGEFVSPLTQQIPPLDPVKVRDAQVREADAIDQDVRECMEAQGFTAPKGPGAPPLSDDTEPVAYGIAQSFDTSVLFITRPATTTTTTTTTTIPSEPVEPMSLEESMALTGTYGTGGCVADARAANVSDSPTPTLDAIAEQIDEMTFAISSDSRIGEANLLWSECMAGRGFDVATPGDAPILVRERFTPLSADGIVTAGEEPGYEAAVKFENEVFADAEGCAESSGLTAARRSVVVEHEVTFIDAHRDELAAARAEINRFNQS